MDSSALAASLINTQTLPAGLSAVIRKASEARAYYNLDPYPAFWFSDWKTEDRGPLPRCMPFARSITDRGARWLFGKPLQIHAPGNPVLEEFLRLAWDANRMPARLPAVARNGSIEGGVALKFSYDCDFSARLRIQTLSVVSQVRLYTAPHDRDQLLMARVQYQFYDNQKGKTYWYREEWTNDEEVHYEPIEDARIGAALPLNPDTFTGWQIISRTPNPFRLIPISLVKNIETDDAWGRGDLWDLYRVLDRVHLTYHLMDRSNQFDSDHNPIFIDADVDEQDIDRPMQPGQPLALESKEGFDQAKVHFPEARGSLRPAMMEYARDLRNQVLAAASSVEVDQSEISNKGNLTQAVLVQLYLPLLEATNEKRQSYGADGIGAFLSKASVGLANAGVSLGLDGTYPSVELSWAPYFELSQDELGALTQRSQLQRDSGLLTANRAVDRVAHAEGINDVGALQKELRAARFAAGVSLPNIPKENL